ncbi:MAG: ACT domain-containing protein, partial [Terriglobales bacterium]
GGGIKTWYKPASLLFQLPHHLKYRVLAERLAACRLASDARIPAWASEDEGKFFCVVRTGDELSIVCAEDRIPDGVRAERGWLALKLEGPFPFVMTGVLASFLQPLAEAEIPIFAISTFDTDYVLIKPEHLEAAVEALGAAGHEKVDEPAG